MTESSVWVSISLAAVLQEGYLKYKESIWGSWG